MRAVQLLGGERIEVRELPDPEPLEGGVVVRVRASALCGSELKAYRGAEVAPGVTNLGHEAVGVVEDASRSRRWRAGDTVGIHAVWGCGGCDPCTRGMATYCERLTVRTGAHAEYLAAPDHVLLPLPADLTDFAVGALLTGDTLGVPFHAARGLRSRAGETVAVVGCGPIGLGTILLQRFFGARVIALDPQAERRAWAERIGASLTIDPSAGDPVAAVREHTGGRLAEAAVEASGTAGGVALALSLAGPGRPVALCGEAGPVTLDVSRDLLRRDRMVFGSWYYHQAEYPEMLEVFRAGLPLPRLISHRFPLAEAAAAFAVFSAGTSAKVVLEC